MRDRVLPLRGWLEADITPVGGSWGEESCWRPPPPNAQNVKSPCPVLRAGLSTRDGVVQQEETSGFRAWTGTVC